MTKEEWEIFGQFIKDVVDRFNDQDTRIEIFKERFNDQEERIKSLEKTIESLKEALK